MKAIVDVSLERGKRLMILLFAMPGGGKSLISGRILNWGPSWYNQKQFFTGEDHPLSNQHNILRYDVEVSDFPSAHAGHIGLLNLKDDDYPNTTKIEEWPSWTLPILQWAKQQGCVTGYVHSGWGLAPIGLEHVRFLREAYSPELPNYIIPRMDNIGANEYVVGSKVTGLGDVINRVFISREKGPFVTFHPESVCVVVE